MNPIDKELDRLREHVGDMLDLVRLQVERAQNSIFEFSEEVVLEVSSTEKTVNNLDLKVDTKCENILALYKPVAIDLRFVMACLSFNTFLERVGDNAIAIVKISEKIHGDFTVDQLKSWRLDEMFDTTLKMLDKVKDGLEADKTNVVAETFTLDKIVNEINAQAEKVLSDYAELDKAHVRPAFALYPVFRKLERVGDLVTNLSEELIFYIDAKVLKHNKKKKEKFIKKS